MDNIWQSYQIFSRDIWLWQGSHRRQVMIDAAEQKNVTESLQLPSTGVDTHW